MLKQEALEDHFVLHRQLILLLIHIRPIRVLAGRRGKPDGGATSTHGRRTLPENDAVGLEVDKLPRNNASDKELLDESVGEVAAL